jgi:hypothetical protein
MRLENEFSTSQSRLAHPCLANERFLPFLLSLHLQRRRRQIIRFGKRVAINGNGGRTGDSLIGLRCQRTLIYPRIVRQPSHYQLFPLHIYRENSKHGRFDT